jgi:hypothetical protein
LNQVAKYSDPIGHIVGDIFWLPPVIPEVGLGVDREVRMLKIMSLISFSAMVGTCYGDSIGPDFNPISTAYVHGPVDQAVQDLVDQFQLWALHKAKDPNWNNNMIAIPRADTSKTVGGSQPLTQEIMDDAASSAAKDIAYSDPLERILSYNLAYQTTVADFLKMEKESIVRELANGDPEKAKTLLEVKHTLLDIAHGNAPVDAKVLGPAVMVADVEKELHSDSYCQPISCDRPRMRVPIMIFGKELDKIQASGLIPQEQLASLEETAVESYFFVQNSEGRWMFEEVIVDGIGWMQAKTSFY